MRQVNPSHNPTESLESFTAAFWEKYWSRCRGEFALQSNPDPLLLLLENKKPSTILEAGCGEGRNTLSLLKNCTTLVSFDESVAAVARTGRRHGSASNLKILHCRAEHVPLPSGSFDLLVYIDLFNHLADWNQVIKEASRLLKKGGWLVANPLSLSDPSMQLLANSSIQISANTFVKEHDFGGNVNTEKLVMRYVNLEDIERAFSLNFRFSRPPTELSRIDPPHEGPFQESEHEHVYWEVLAEKK